jgi:hydroxyacylglutathione hydrolase
MKITDGVHLIASGNLGVNLTHPLDCNVYALRCGDRYWIIDSGAGIATERILDELERDGVRDRQIGGLLLTHYHLDHAGGAAWMHRTLAVPVMAGTITAQALQTGDEEAISLAPAKRAGVYPTDVRFDACPVNRTLTGGKKLILGDTEIEIIETPGHSRDGITYLARQRGRAMLFPGDTLFYGGRIVLQGSHDCDTVAHSASLRKIAALDFDMMFPGHNLWSLKDAHRHIDTAMTYVDKLLLPPNLI